MKKYYAQIDAGGKVIAALETEGTIAAAHMIETAQAFEVIGKRWDGAAFVDVAPDAKTLAAAKLAEIDARSGMSRLMRETLIALAGANAPATLKTYETQAAAERAKLV